MEFVRGTGGDLQGQRLINQGSGWFMGFSPKPENYGNVFRRLSDVKTLYGSPLQANVENEEVIAQVRARVNETMKKYPLFAY